MEVLPSSSGATAVSPQLASASAGRVSREGNGLPAFAQVVREALHQTANSSTVQHPAVASKLSASPTASPKTTVKTKTPRPSGRDENQTRDTPSGGSAVNTVLLPSLLLALQAINQNQQSQTGGSPLGSVAVDNSGA